MPHNPRVLSLKAFGKAFSRFRASRSRWLSITSIACSSTAWSFISIVQRRYTKPEIFLAQPTCWSRHITRSWMSRYSFPVAAYHTYPASRRRSWTCTGWNKERFQGCRVSKFQSKASAITSVGFKLCHLETLNLAPYGNSRSPTFRLRRPSAAAGGGDRHVGTPALLGLHHLRRDDSALHGCENSARL